MRVVDSFGRRVEALQATLDFLVRNPSAEDVLLMTEELAAVASSSASSEE